MPPYGAVSQLCFRRRARGPAPGHDRAELLDRVLDDPVAHGLANALPPDDPAQQQPPEVLGGVADRHPGGSGDLADAALPALVQDADDPQAGRVTEQAEPPGGLLQDGIWNDGHAGTLLLIIQ